MAFESSGTAVCLAGVVVLVFGSIILGADFLPVSVLGVAVGLIVASVSSSESRETTIGLPALVSSLSPRTSSISSKSIEISSDSTPS